MTAQDGYNISAPANFPAWSHKSGKIGLMVPFDVGGSSIVSTYRMRGYDTTLLSTVYWSSDHVDADASDYTGPGPVTGIVVQKIRGA